MAETGRRGELRLEGRKLTRGRKGEPREGSKLKMEGGRNEEERNFTR